MKIRSARSLAGYIEPLGNHGAKLLVWDGYTARGVERDGYNPIPPRMVLRALERLQRSLPLGWARGMDVLCLPWVMGRYEAAHGGVVGTYEAESEKDGRLIALSASRWPDDQDRLAGLLAHELGHALFSRLCGWSIGAEPTPAVQELADRLGIGLVAPPSAAVFWGLRPQEQLAEFVSAAIWGFPLDERVAGVLPLTPERAATMREWVHDLAARSGDTGFEVLDPPRQIVLRIGDTTALVDGQPVTLDQPAVIINDRTMLPARFVAEAFGHLVDWNGEAQTVSITQGEG